MFPQLVYWRCYAAARHVAAARTVDGLLNATLMDDLWQGVLARLDAHSLTNYRNRIGNA